MSTEELEKQPLKEEVKQDEGEEKPSQKKEISIPDCTVHSVVVYPDRAEVTRLVTVDLEPGSAEVVIKNISKSLDKDSIRVDGIGPASVTEVSFQEIAVTEEEEDSRENASAEVTELKEKIKAAEERKEKTKQQMDRMTAQIELFDKYSTGLFSAGGQTITNDLLDQKTIDGVFGYLETFEERTVRLRVDKDEVNSDDLSTARELTKLNTRLYELQPLLSKPSEPVKQQVIGVLLDVKSAAQIQLLISYVVSNAGWTPKYDLRVSSSERTMQVTYFGVVKQSTGEDWLNARLSLSTATPSIGGSAPTLETLKLTIIPNLNPQLRGGTGKKKSRHSGFGFGEESSVIEAPPSKVSEGLINSVFEISTPTNIPADNSGHKVHVAQIDLKPTFEYDTVPKLAQHAFLRAKAVNNSQYPFLSGPSNVFLDNSYVTETTLASVSPNEEFGCSLGVDLSVKVVYKPVSRFREETGLFSKTVVYKYKQVTEILNTRSEPAVITFTDQVPKSEDEKLKVTLLEPVIAKQKQGSPSPNPKLNSQNNVEWRLELGPGESRSVTIYYTVEFPVNKEVEGLGL